MSMDPGNLRCRLPDQGGFSACHLGLANVPASLIRSSCRRPAVARPAVVTMRAAAAQLPTTGAVPVGPALHGGRVNAVTLHRITTVPPIGQPPAVTADFAVARGL